MINCKELTWDFKYVKIKRAQKRLGHRQTYSQDTGMTPLSVHTRLTYKWPFLNQSTVAKIAQGPQTRTFYSDEIRKL
jgi:hypothetical protein